MKKMDLTALGIVIKNRHDTIKNTEKIIFEVSDMKFQPLRDFMDFYLPMIGVPGSDLVIYKDHDEIFRYQSGFDNLNYRTPVRTDALYNLYSCTKVATCVAATQLIERGEILATDPVYAYFPEYKNIKIRVKNEKGEESILPAKNVLTIAKC